MTRVHTRKVYSWSRVNCLNKSREFLNHVAQVRILPGHY